MLRLLQYNSGHVQFVNYFIYTHLIELVMHDRSELSQNSLVVSEAPSVYLVHINIFLSTLNVFGLVHTAGPNPDPCLIFL